MIFSKSPKFFFVIILLPLLILPAYGQTQSQQIKITSGGTIDIGFSTDPANSTSGDQTLLKISFINKQTNEIQKHIDYRVVVTQGQNVVFGIQPTHTGEGAVSIPYTFQNAGDYQVTVYVEGILFSPIPPEYAVFPLTVSTKTPEFGPVAMLVLVIAVISIIAFTAKTRGIPRL